jgi:ribonucleotide reductase alpha subunit
MKKEMAMNKTQKWDWKKELETNQYISPIQRQIIERLHDSSYMPFALDKSYVAKYSRVKPPFGFNGFGELVYMRTYSRLKEDGANEVWPETVERVVNGTFNLQKRWIQSRGLEWSDYKAQTSAQEMYDRMFHMKFLPPGRGLWAMGSEATEERGLYSALNNCSFVSTDNLKDDLSKPFRFLMDMSMVGVGVGFDTRGSGKVMIRGPDKRRSVENFVIPDSREGWVEATGRLIDSYFLGIQPVKLDYSQIRSRGQIIGGFGGKSSGHEPLEEMHKNLETILDKEIERPITSRAIVDVMNVIGKCVVAGNVRRTAEISVGDPDDETFLDLKDYTMNPERASFGWTSNNSVFGKLGMDYNEIAERIRKNGEPGVIWLDNIREYSRMGQPKDNKDSRAVGCNPSLRKGTKIWTTKGIVPIETLQDKSFFVRNLKNKIVPAKCWLSSPKETLFKITLKGGHIYYCTKEHKWPIFTPQGFSKVDTSELKIGHLLPIIKNKEISTGKLGDYSDGLFIGWLIGDGGIHIRKDDGRKQINLIVSENDRKDSEIANFLLDKINSLKKSPSSWVDRKGNFELSCSSDEIMKYLNKFGYTGKQELPTNIWTQWSEQSIRGLVDGLYSSDGSVECSYKNAKIKLYAKSLNLVKEVSEILGFYGIKNAIIEVNSVLNNKKFKNYVLVIADRTSIDHYKNIFKLSVTHKQSRLNKISNMTKRNLYNNIQEVVSIEESNLEEPVWDISVLDNTHCFQLAHMITGNCVEQSLESYETCNLVENFPNNHKDVEDFKRTLKFAYMYAKTVTLGETHWPETNRVLLRNRRIGCSVSGVAQFVAQRGLGTLKDWLEKGYDEIDRLDKIYSEWMTVPVSIKRTSVKPSGSVSSVAGATSGMHWPISEYYIRRMRIAKGSELVDPLKRAGYTLEDAVDDPSSTVVEFPVHVGDNIESEQNVSMWEQFGMAAFLQKHWSDNQVSCTIKFDPEKEGPHIARALDQFQYQLKGVSMLPKREGMYKQPPYEPITREQYIERSRVIKPIEFGKIKNEKANVERFCTNDTCELPPTTDDTKENPSTSTP